MLRIICGLCVRGLLGGDEPGEEIYEGEIQANIAQDPRHSLLVERLYSPMGGWPSHPVGHLIPSAARNQVAMPVSPRSRYSREPQRE